MTGPAYEKIMRQAIRELNEGGKKSFFASRIESLFINFIGNVAGIIYLVIAIPVTLGALLGFLSFMFIGV